MECNKFIWNEDEIYDWNFFSEIAKVDDHIWCIHIFTYPVDPIFIVFFSFNKTRVVELSSLTFSYMIYPTHSNRIPKCQSYLMMHFCLSDA